MKKLCSVLLMVSIFLLQLQAFSPVSFASESANVVRTMLLEEDFSDASYVVDTAYTGDQMAEINTKLDYSGSAFSLSKNTAASYTVKQIDADDASKGKYLEFGVGSASSHATMISKFDPVTEGTLVTEFRLRIPNGGSGIKRNNTFVGIFGNDDGYLKTLYWYADGKDSKLVAQQENGWVFSGYNSGTVSYDLSKDEYGFMSVRLVWSRESAAEGWNVKLYDAYNGALIREANNVAMDSINHVRFAQTYKTGTDTAVIDYADIKVYRPHLTGKAEFDEIKFTQGGNEVNALPANATDLSVSLTTKASDSINAYSLILAVYEKDGTLVDTKVLSGVSGGVDQVTLSLSELELEAGAYAKLFLWRDMSTLYPLRAPEVLSAEGF